MTTAAPSAARRRAACRCGRVEVLCVGDPERVSICHCQACQSRTGSVFSAQARFQSDQVVLQGETRVYVRTANSGRRATYQFCPDCGSTVAYVNEGAPDIVAVPLGAFTDPLPMSPSRAYFERRRKPWLRIEAEGLEHFDLDS